MTKENLPTYLKTYREKADLTQGELADKIGVSRQSIISLEASRCVPSVELAMRIARFFELPVEFIFRQEVEADECETVVDKILNNNNEGGGTDMTRNLMPWSPWREMMSLRENIDKFFDEPSLSHRGTPGVFHPAVSIRETQKEMIIEADVPGVRDEDVDVEIEDDKVIIKGERKHQQETKREDYYHMESSYGSFSRVIGLPNYVNADKAVAEVKDGILEVKVPKVEQRQPKKIKVATKKTEVRAESKKEIHPVK